MVNFEGERSEIDNLSHLASSSGMQRRRKNDHTEKAAEFIRYRILSGTYPAGFRLKTIDLAAESGVSRTPVREALRQLQQEGLVDIQPRLGARVRTISYDEFKEMCELRLAMESFAAELAAINRSPTDLVEMEDAMNTMTRLVGELESRGAQAGEAIERDLAKADIQFHVAILNAAGNKLLRDEVLRFHLFNKLININFPRVNAGITEAGRMVSGTNARRQFVLECHRRIFDAIVARQSEPAHGAMYEHLKEIIDRNMMALARLDRGTPNGSEVAGLEVLSASV